MSTIIESRALRPHIPTTCNACHVSYEFPVPSPPPASGAQLNVRCYQCQAVKSHAFYPGQIPAQYSSASHTAGGTAGGSGAQQTQVKKKGRTIGTQERPLETGYYDLLGVQIDATTDEVKKAYRRAAIKHHPDKNRDDPNAEERFKEIAIAYQTLSDPALRKKYNEFGPRASQPEGGFVDPEEIFGAMFGGDRFEPLIGRISLAKDMKAAMQDDDEEDGTIKGPDGHPLEKKYDAKGKEIISPEEKARRDAKERKISAEKAAQREERVAKLVEILERKLAIFAEQANSPEDAETAKSWRMICDIEANELRKESYGVELLHTIGFVYSSKAKHYLATSQTFLGVGGWLHNVQGKYHVFSETVGTVRAAIELKGVFDQIAKAERDGTLSPEEKAKLETQAAEKGIQALFKGTKLEIDSVLREVCDRVLEDPNVSVEKRRLRATALQIMGEQYAAVRKDADDEKDEAEYVRVETKASRERESQGRAGGYT